MVDPEKDLIAERDSKVRRISRQTRGLVEDMRSWVDLKMQYTQLDLEDRVDKKVNEAARGAVFGAIALIALVFILITASLGLGLLFESTFYGFLSVSGFLVLVLVVAMLIHPRLVKVEFFNRGNDEPKQLKS